jgi:CRP-like cAMP-binding protein
VADCLNRLLLKLASEDLAAVLPCLELIELEKKHVVIEPNEPIEHVYFPETCVFSLMAVSKDGQPIEVGMFGFEGVSDLVTQYGDTTPMRSMVQVRGATWRMTAQDFAKALRTVPSLNGVVLRYKEALAIQFAYTALAHGTFTIEERLARWLLMSHDRTQRGNMPIVHEFIASMLAVRRSGVTTAIHILEGAGAIRASRGTIVIRDRDKLIEIANGSYGVPEREYERLLRN